MSFGGYCTVLATLNALLTFFAKMDGFRMRRRRIPPLLDRAHTEASGLGQSVIRRLDAGVSMVPEMETPEDDEGVRVGNGFGCDGHDTEMRKALSGERIKGAGGNNEAFRKFCR